MIQALEHKRDNAESLLVYGQLRTVLRDELGAPPSLLSQALHRRLLGDAR